MYLMNTIFHKPEEIILLFFMLMCDSWYSLTFFSLPTIDFVNFSISTFTLIAADLLFLRDNYLIITFHFHLNPTLIKGHKFYIALTYRDDEGNSINFVFESFLTRWSIIRFAEFEKHWIWNWLVSCDLYHSKNLFFPRIFNNTLHLYLCHLWRDI